MLEPLPLDEHWTIWPLPSQSATWPSVACAVAEEDQVGGLVAARRRVRADAADARLVRRRRSRCRAAVRSRATAATVVEPMSMPACANAQRANIEQSQVAPAGSRVCISVTVPPRSVDGPWL